MPGHSYRLSKPPEQVPGVAHRGEKFFAISIDSLERKDRRRGDGESGENRQFQFWQYHRAGCESFASAGECHPC